MSNRKPQITPHLHPSQNQPPPSTNQTSSRYPITPHTASVSTSTRQNNPPNINEQQRSHLSTTHPLIPVSNSKLNQSHSQTHYSTPNINNSSHNTSHQSIQTNSTINTPSVRNTTARQTNLLQTPHKSSSTHTNTSSHTHQQTPSLHKQPTFHNNLFNTSLASSSTLPSSLATKYDEWISLLGANRITTTRLECNKDATDFLNTKLYELELKLSASSSNYQHSHHHEPEHLLGQKQYDLTSFQLATVQIFGNLCSNFNLAHDEIRKFSLFTINTPSSSSTLSATWNDMIKALATAYKKALVPQIIESMQSTSTSTQTQGPHHFNTSHLNLNLNTSMFLNSNKGIHSATNIDTSHALLSPRSTARNGINSTFSINNQNIDKLQLDLSTIQDSNSLVMDTPAHFNKSLSHSQHSNSSMSGVHTNTHTLQQQLQELLQQNQSLIHRNKALEQEVQESKLMKQNHLESIDGFQDRINDLQKQNSLLQTKVHEEQKKGTNFINTDEFTRLSMNLNESLQNNDILEAKYQRAKGIIQKYQDKYGVLIKKSSLKQAKLLDRSDITPPIHLSNQTSFNQSIIQRKVNWLPDVVEKVGLTYEDHPSRTSVARFRPEFSYDYDTIENMTANLFSCPSLQGDKKPILIEYQTRNNTTSQIQPNTILDSVPSSTMITFHEKEYPSSEPLRRYAKAKLQQHCAMALAQEEKTEVKSFFRRIRRHQCQIANNIDLVDAYKQELDMIMMLKKQKQNSLQHHPSNNSNSNSHGTSGTDIEDNDEDDDDDDDKRDSIFTMQDKFIYICKLHYYQHIDALYLYQTQHCTDIDTNSSKHDTVGSNNSNNNTTTNNNNINNINNSNNNNSNNNKSTIFSNNHSISRGVDITEGILNTGVISISQLYTRINAIITTEHMLGASIIYDVLAYIWNTIDFASYYKQYFPLHDPLKRKSREGISVFSDQFKTHLFEWIDVKTVFLRTQFPYITPSTHISLQLQQFDTTKQLSHCLELKQLKMSNQTKSKSSQTSFPYTLSTSPSFQSQFTTQIDYSTSKLPIFYKNHEHSLNSLEENSNERETYLKAWERYKPLYLDVYNTYYWLYSNVYGFLTKTTQQDAPYDCPPQSCFFPWFSHNASLFFTAPKLFKPITDGYHIRSIHSRNTDLDGTGNGVRRSHSQISSSSAENHKNTTHMNNSDEDNNDDITSSPKRSRMRQLIIPDDDNDYSDCDLQAHLPSFSSSFSSKPRTSLLGYAMFSPQPLKRRSARASEENEQNLSSCDFDFDIDQDNLLSLTNNPSDNDLSDLAQRATPHKLSHNLPFLQIAQSGMNNNSNYTPNGKSSNLLSTSTLSKNAPQQHHQQHHQQRGNTFFNNSNNLTNLSNNGPPLSFHDFSTSFQQLLTPFTQFFPSFDTLPELTDLVQVVHPITGISLPMLQISSISNTITQLSLPSTTSTTPSKTTTTHPSLLHNFSSTFLPSPHIISLCQGLDINKPTKINHISLILTKDGLVLNRISKQQQTLVPFSSICSISASPISLPTTISSLFTSLSFELTQFPMIITELQRFSGIRPYSSHSTPLSSHSSSNLNSINNLNNKQQQPTLKVTDSLYKILQMYIFAALSMDTNNKINSNNNANTRTTTNKSFSSSSASASLSTSSLSGISQLPQLEVIPDSTPTHSHLHSQQHIQSSSLTNHHKSISSSTSTTTPITSSNSYFMTHPTDCIITPLWIRFIEVDDTDNNIKHKYQRTSQHQMLPAMKQMSGKERCLKFMFQSNQETIIWLTTIRAQLAYIMTPYLFADLLNCISQQQQQQQHQQQQQQQHQQQQQQQPQQKNSSHQLLQATTTSNVIPQYPPQPLTPQRSTTNSTYFHSHFHPPPLQLQPSNLSNFSDVSTISNLSNHQQQHYPPHHQQPQSLRATELSANPSYKSPFSTTSQSNFIPTDNLSTISNPQQFHTSSTPRERRNNDQHDSNVNNIKSNTPSHIPPILKKSETIDVLSSHATPQKAAIKDINNYDDKKQKKTLLDKLFSLGTGSGTEDSGFGY